MFLFSLALQLLSISPEAAIIAKVPSDWYLSTTKLFDYCVEVNFQHPICPQINSESKDSFNFESEFFTPPVGPLTSKTLFQATILYQVNRPPVVWFIGLKLDKARPRDVEERMWAEAQYLWARILFDQRKYEDSAYFFNKIVDQFRGKALFHQQRGWVQFFTGKYDQALGSIVAAESPLIYPVPFFEKYFIRGLVERETCHWPEAFNTLGKGRAALQYASPKADKHPWVVLCSRRSLGPVCDKLKVWYEDYYRSQIKKALADLDLLEVELRDKGASAQADKSDAPLVWPFTGESWMDELGYYSVPTQNQCS